MLNVLAVQLAVNVTSPSLPASTAVTAVVLPNFAVPQLYSVYAEPAVLDGVQPVKVYPVRLAYAIVRVLS